MSSFSSSVRSILPMAGAHSHRQSQLHHQQPSSRLLLLLTVLPLTLATLAFVLQWRGGVTDPVTRWSPDHDQFPGMATAVPSLRHHSDCGKNPLSQSYNPSFPYFRDWTFDFSSNLSPKVPIINPNPTFNSPLSKNSPFTNPDSLNWFFPLSLGIQICITTSTSAGLEQTLPWIFYHKVIGVSSFLLFVEGKAASPNVTRVLETIPVSSNSFLSFLSRRNSHVFFNFFFIFSVD